MGDPSPGQSGPSHWVLVSPSEQAGHFQTLHWNRGGRLEVEQSLNFVIGTWLTHSPHAWSGGGSRVYWCRRAAPQRERPSAGPAEGALGRTRLSRLPAWSRGPRTRVWLLGPPSERGSS